MKEVIPHIKFWDRMMIKYLNLLIKFGDYLKKNKNKLRSISLVFILSCLQLFNKINPLLVKTNRSINNCEVQFIDELEEYA